MIENNNRRLICEPALWQRADSTMVDYRDDSLAIPDKVPDRTALQLILWAPPNPEHPYRGR